MQALGGAKNHLVVMPDADMPKTVEAIIGSAFGAAGERCLAGSVLVPVGDAAGPLLDLLVEAHARRWRSATARRAGVEMGPLVTSDHCKQRRGLYRKGRGRRRDAAGATAAQRKPDGGGFFLGPTIFDHVTPEMTIAEEEIFGPVLSVMRVKTLDDAIELVNRSPFGNATVDFHQQRQVGARVLVANRSRHGGSQRRRRRAHGLLPVRRLEEFVLRRPARPRQRRRRVLHRAEGHHEPVVLVHSLEVRARSSGG